MQSGGYGGGFSHLKYEGSNVLSKIVTSTIIIIILIAVIRVYAAKPSDQSIMEYLRGSAQDIATRAEGKLSEFSWERIINGDDGVNPAGEPPSQGGVGTVMPNEKKTIKPDAKQYIPGRKTGETKKNPTAPVGSNQVAEVKTLAEQLKVAPPSKAPYSREDYKHWNYLGSSCWNVREQVLVNQSQNPPVLLDGSKNKTANIKAACSIESGYWVDPYSGNVFTEPKKLDIDHIIPLSYVNQHGGSNWAPKTKKAYANDLDVLLAVSAKENRSKSDKGPSEYMPPNKNYQCQYAFGWVKVATKYGITVTQKDKDVLKTVLSGC